MNNNYNIEESKNTFPLTDIQLAYLLGRNPKLYLGGNSTHFYAEVITELDPVRLQRAFNKVIRRQPMLRTVILPEGVQQVLDKVPEYEITVIDIRDKTLEEQEKIILEKREKTTHRMFQTDVWPLFGFCMYHTSETEYRMLADFDMMIVDGLSIEIMINEVMACYENEEQEQKELTYTFRDYIVEHKKLVEEKREADEAFWAEQVKKMPLGPELPVHVEEGKVYRFSQKEFIIDAESWSGMKQELMDKRVIPAMYLLASYAKMLSKFCNQTEFTVNLTTTNRRGEVKNLSEVIGDFTEILPIDVYFDKGQTVLKAAKDAQKRLVHYRRYNTIGGVHVMKKVSEYNQLASGIPFPVVFTSMLFDTAQSGWNKLGKRVYQISQTPQVLLDSTVTERNGSLILRWDYLEGCFEPELISDMFNFYVQELLNAVNDEHGTPDSVSAWISYNDTADTSIEDKTLQQMFLEKAKIFPEKTALICGEEQITYGELDRRSSCICATVAEKYGTGRAFVLEACRSIDTVAWMLGILKSGGYYIPVETTWPMNRKQYIFENSGAAAIIDPSVEKIVESVETNFGIINDNTSSLAYIIYTSGSTGAPKGVAITQSAVCNTIQDINRKFDITEKDVVLGISSYCFDLSIYDVFGALSAGASCVIMKDRTSVEEYNDILKKHPISVWNSVPAILGMFVDNSSVSCDSMRRIMLSGDWIPLELPEKTKKNFANAEMFSLGGATEAAIWSIYYPINNVDSTWSSIPYGYPLANQTIYVLDYEKKLSPFGVDGEIYIGGKGVAAGYLNDDEKTNAHFYVHPEFGRIYRTGDYGCLSREGYVIFKGRKDEQVKLHGYRVELGEIENRIKQYKGIQEAAVIVDEHEGSQHLLGYVVPEKCELETCSNHAESACVAAEKESCHYPEEISLSDYRSSMDRLDTAAIGIMVESLKAIGVADVDGKLLSIEDMIRYKGVSPKYEKVLEQWIEVLREQGFIEETGGQASFLLSKETDIDVDAIFTEILEIPQMKYWQEFFEFVLLCRTNMKKILCAEVNPVTILFPDGDWSRAENYYRKNPIAEYHNRIVAKAIGAYVATQPGCTRILEVGAGTGGTSYDIFREICGENVEYTYTDLSTFFTEKAKERFSEYDFIRYGLYTIDKDPQSQGYGVGEYDIVIGANVLHDAAVITDSLGHLSRLLKKDGMLILLETTKNRLIQKVSVGLIEGFSGYNDERIERKQPLLTVDEWKEAFTESGYGSIAVYPVVDSMDDDFEQHILIAVPEKKRVDVPVNELKDYLKTELPSYMLPEWIYIIDEIPLSSNGKVRKNLLPKYTTLANKKREQAIAAPGNEIEQLLLDILIETLRESEISVDANLFEMGIDSLKAISVVTKCKEKGLDFSLVDLYSYPTIRALADMIMQKSVEETDFAQKIDYKQFAVEPHYDFGRYELNEIQKAYLYGRNPAFELGNISTHYYAEIETELDICRLEDSLNRVIAHQAMLRTVIYEDGTQEILKEVEWYRIMVEDISELDEAKQLQRKNELREAMSHQMHEIGKWPMFELKAVRTGEGKYDLYFSLDVMLSDGASILMMWNEIASCYNGHTLPALKFHFSDYLESLHALENSEIYQADEAYWTEKVEDFPPCVPLPYRTAFVNVKNPHFRRLSAVLDKNDWEKFKDVAKRRHLTPAALLCSAYSTVLAKYSNCSNFGINMTVFNRYPFYEQVNQMIGDFTSTCILDIHAQKNIWKQTEEIQKTIFSSMEHRHYDGIKFLKQLSRKSGNPLAAIMPVIFTCALFDTDMSELNSLGEIRYILSQTSQAALDNQTTCLNGQLHIAWDFVDQIFDEELIEDMFQRYVELIQKISCDEENPELDNFAIEQRIAEYNSTEKPYEPVILDWLFEQQVKKAGEAEAVICGERTVSYVELDRMANQVANYIASHDYKGRGVAVLGEKTVETVAAILGILKAGCYYIPASPDFPEARRKYIMENSDCEIMLDTEMIKKSILGQYDDVFVGVPHSSEERAYIIYTSGSTGMPKGVVISHGAAANTILDINKRFHVGPGDRIIGLSAFSFDLSVYDLFGALSTGAALVLVQEYRDVNEVKSILREKNITFWNSVPALMQMTAEAMEDGESIDSLKNVLLSGDWIPLNLPEKIRKKFPNADITSLGGATEASIWSIFYPINEVDMGWKSIPYGYPLDNQMFYVLDESGEPCPVGVRGELYIGGIGLAMGYINNEEETRKRFVQHEKYGKIYRTGDYGIFRKEGFIEFLGRVDDQVKLHGYRIELEEISDTLKKHEKVDEALSVVTDGESSSILSYVIPKIDRESCDNYDLSSWNDAVEAGESNAAETPTEITVERYCQLENILEEESLSIMLSTVRKLYETAFEKPLENAEINIHLLVQKNGIRELYTKMIRQWFMEFVRCGYAKEITRDVYRMADKDALKNIPEVFIQNQSEIKEAAYFEEALHFLTLCNENILDLLTGEETILNLLFPKGKWDVAENLYQSNPIAEYYNRIVAETIASFISGKRNVKILETGAGIGGTTAAVLKRLENEHINYTYTDLSTFFTDTAKKVYEPYAEKITYDLFDINLTPQEQGYGLEEYDVIMAANMLHDAKYLNVTLKNLKNMLKPGGILIFLEQNRNTRLQMVTTALIDGFSDYNDFRLEQNAPLLGAEQWTALLKDNGFSDPQCFPSAGSKSELYGQSVIVGRKAGGRDFLTEEELEEVLEHTKQFLPKYMIPNRIIQLDSFPLSANGKVSRKLLPVPKAASRASSRTEKPSTETEKILFDKWVSVLGTDDFGLTDDFYSAGGDSLKAIQLISNLNADKELDIRRFMDGASIKEVAAYLDEENIKIQ